MKASRSGEKKIEQPYSLNGNHDVEVLDEANSSERTGSTDSYNSKASNSHPLEEKFIKKSQY